MPDCEPLRHFAATKSEDAFPDWFNGIQPGSPGDASI
jgi:hypothetical protein